MDGKQSPTTSAYEYQVQVRFDSLKPGDYFSYFPFNGNVYRFDRYIAGADEYVTELVHRGIWFRHDGPDFPVGHMFYQKAADRRNLLVFKRHPKMQFD